MPARLHTARMAPWLRRGVCLFALAAFNLGSRDAADRHFLQLLQLNPDYVLDPFAVPPPAIKLFEEVKKKHADSLALIRQQIALREEQQRREAAETERRKALEEAERRRLEELTRNVQVKVIEKRSLIAMAMLSRLRLGVTSPIPQPKSCYTQTESPPISAIR